MDLAFSDNEKGGGFSSSAGEVGAAHVSPSHSPLRRAWFPDLVQAEKCTQVLTK